MTPLTPWAVLVALCLASPASAASVNSLWSVRTWRTDDGLPNNTVTSLAQSPDGFLWIATPTWLARFDGLHFEKFRSEAVVPGRHERISMLLTGRGNALWLGMDHGPLVKLQAGAREVFTNGFPNSSMQVLLEDHEGAVWIKYRGGAIYRCRNGSVTHYTREDGLPPTSGSSITTDNRGTLWFAKGGVVGTFRNERFHNIHRLTRTGTTIRITPSRQGGIWAWTGSQLFHCDEQQVTEKPGKFLRNEDAAEVTVMLEDRGGGLWIGTTLQGLFHYDGSRLERIVTPHRQILSLLEDREGNIWVGTGGGGLSQIRPRAVELETTDSGLPYDAVQSVCEDSSGVLWAVTGNNLIVTRSNNAWLTISTNASWPGGRPSCAVVDRSDALWIGTLSGALHRLQHGQYTTWRRTNGLVSRTIYSLLAASNGDVWVGGNAPESIQRLRQGEFQKFLLPSDVRVIRALAEDCAGDIWAGTSKGVLLRISGEQVLDETIRVLGKEASEASGNPLAIRALHGAADGTLWMGFAGGGIGWFKDGRFHRVGTDQGLHDDYICQVVTDDEDGLWLGADHGIFKVARRDLENLALGRTDRVRSTPYGQNAGLPGLQASFGTTPGAMRSRDGRVLIPMRTALAVIHPRRIRPVQEAPPVILQRITVDEQIMASYRALLPTNSEIDLTQPSAKLRIPPNHHKLEFEFTGLSFSAPENVQFRYRLDDFDHNWVEAGTRRFANFGRLPAGEYTFRVKACNADGIWNEHGATIAFVVTPFFWQTWWFRLGLFALLVSSVAAIVRYVSFRRLRLKLAVLEQQTTLDKERARIAKDIHDDLGGNLTQMALLLELARQDRGEPAKQETHMQQISSAMRQVNESLDEIVWAVNPRNDRLPDLITYISQFAMEFTRAAGLRCQVEMPESPVNQHVSPEERHNLFLAVKEALNNIVRHARATEVRVRLNTGPDSLAIAIEDNGRGFAVPPQNATADGLRNMRQRMEEVGGRFQVESVPGKGTRVSLVLPWNGG